MEPSGAHEQSSSNAAGSPISNPSIENYTIGWICALQEEYEAACRMLDDEFDGPEVNEVNDNNTYLFGCINGHMVVIGCLPTGRYGISPATSVAKDMVRSFPNLRFALIVGIGGGAATRERDIRLGDVVVSVPQGKLGGVVQYDFGRRLSNGRFQQTGQLDAPPPVLLGVIPEMKRRHNDRRKPDRVAEHLKLMDDMPEYQRPAEDRLYRADFEHNDGNNCENCDVVGLVERPRRGTSRDVTVHYGIIASANSVMTDAKERDRYANDPELNVLCFEMEASGLMNNFPCLVIRGISDYSDSHKRYEWHNYAALAAAAYARELLHVLKPQKVTVAPAWAGKIEELLINLQGRVQENSRKADKIIYHQQNQKNKGMLDWLTPIDYGPRQSDYIMRRQPGTGQWLLDSVEFRALLESDKQTLFCPGIPGAGKTILSSIVVDHLNVTFRNNPTVGIAYIYCNYKEQQKQKQNPEDLLSNLLKQLAQQQPTMPTSVERLFTRHEAPKTRPSLDEIFEALNSTIHLYSKVFVVIDALDEYHGLNRDEHNRLLLAVFSLQHQKKLHLFATSRHVEEITSKFQGCMCKEIRAQDDDVLRYINARMPQLLRSQMSEYPEVQDVVREDVAKAADGMFLLAQLHMDSLMSRPTLGHIKQALKTLPQGSEGLDQTYSHAIERITHQPEGYRKLANQLLSWVTHAKRVLSLAELQHALAVQAGMRELDKDFLPEIDIFGSICAGLVTVDTNSDTVRLVHYTTQEFFVRNSLFKDAHMDITTACVTYLSFSAFETGFCQTDEEFEARLQNNVLYDYAARYWGYHAHTASFEEDLIVRFLESRANVSAAGQAMVAYRSSWGYSQRAPMDITGVHVAAYFGLERAIIGLLKKMSNLEKATVDLKDSYRRTPLSWAAEKGHEAVVKLLLETGKVDVNARDREYGQTPLLWAAENGHEAVVRLLLETGKVDVNAENSDGWTTLSWAAENGHEAVVKLLLETGKVDVNAEDSDGWTPLFCAARNGHQAVVKLLLETGKVNVNAKDSDGWTPLFCAARNGHQAVVKLLLETGKVDVNAKDREGWTPLLWAAEKGHEALVKLLRSHVEAL